MVPLVATLPFQDSLRTVTAAAVPGVHWPFQPFETPWPAVKVNVNVQLVSGSPRFVIMMLPPKPVPPTHAWLYDAWHAVAASAGLAGIVASRPPVRIPTDANTTGR